MLWGLDDVMAARQAHIEFSKPLAALAAWVDAMIDDCVGI